jgi:hypothetical protein
MTISTIPTTIISLLLFGCILLVLGTIMDAALEIDNTMMQDLSLPYSAAHADSMNLGAMAFKAMGIIALVTAGIFLLMNGVQDQSGGV